MEASHPTPGKLNLDLIFVPCVGLVQEYCDGQTFSARCPGEDEVVMVRSAVYGRMRLGRCINVQSDLVCETNILQQ